jgi:hypothetical protein
MIYTLKKKEDKFIDKIYMDSMKDLNKFYGIGWKHGRPSVFIVQSRKEIDEIKDMKSERWIVGWTYSNKLIFVLDRKKFGKESNHKYYTDKTYEALLKHEISHAFYSILSSRKTSPRWLCEGVAIYTSGQNKFKKPITKFNNFLSFYDNGGGDIYYESGFAIEVLVKKYGKKKLLKLISSLKTVRNKNDFSKLFNKIYGFRLSYKEFNSLLKEIR